MKNKIIVALFIEFLLSPFTNYGQNPIIQTIYTADPAPLVYNDTLYLYTGHDEDNSTYFTMKEWRCYSTTDMVNWTDHGSPLSLKNFSWAKSDAWAGQCINRNGKFYWYVPITKNTGGMGIGVAISDNPTGPFTDALGHPLITNSEIDPTVFIDDDGQAYLYWGNPNLFYVKLNEDMISYSGEIVQVPLTQEGFGIRTGDSNRSTQFEEAPWLCKRNDLYYMLYAAGGVPENIAYSTAPSAIGPWTYRDTIMPVQGGSFTNHQGLADYKGKSYFFYHNGALPGGGGFTRSVCVEEFVYNADGTIPTFNMSAGIVNEAGHLNPYVRNEFETIAWESGIETIASSEVGVFVTDIDNNDYIKVRSVDFGATGAGIFTANVASALIGGTVELHLDNSTGLLIGTLPVSYTGGWDMWKTETTDISGATGIHDLYLVFKGDTKVKLFNLDCWTFGEKSTAHDLAAINASIDKYKIDTISGLNTANMKVVAIYADGTSENVTNVANAVPNIDGIVSINNGTITGIGYSSINIDVTYEGKTDVQSLIVKDLIGEMTVKELTSDTNNVIMVVGGTLSYIITATYVDGHTEDVTQIATYTNPNLQIASITKGLITAKKAGSTSVTVSFKGEKGAAVTTSLNITVTNRNPYLQNEAEDMSGQSGVQIENCSDTGGGSDVGFIDNGDWIKIKSLDFGAGTSSFNARVASATSGGKIEIRLDSPTGTLAGTCTINGTGGWQTWVTKSCSVTGVTGIHDIYLVFTGGSGSLFNFNWWKFIATTTSLNNVIKKSPISVVLLDQKKYLKGAQDGDIVHIYNIYGQKLLTFIATSDMELINNFSGVALIEVYSGKQRYSFKTIL